MSPLRIDPSGWLADPLTAIALLVLVALYVDGVLRTTTQEARQPNLSRHTAAFFAGIGLCALTLLSPLDALGDRFFAAHMSQHLLLIVVVAPLLAWSDASRILPLALPVVVRHQLSRWWARPALQHWHRGPRVAWLAAAMFAVTIWGWHIPAAHDAALGNPALHFIEHLTVLGTATLFWHVILNGAAYRVGPGVAAVVVSLVSLQGSLLSAILMFAPRQLCGTYAGNPIEDQVMAGLLMCIPASFVYLASTIWALSRLMGEGRSRAS